MRWTRVGCTTAPAAIVLAVLAACSGTGRPPSLPPSAGEVAVASLPVPPNYVRTFGSSFTFNGTRYPFSVVGANPALHTTTSIPTEVIPIKLIFPDGTTFDPTVPVSLPSSLEASPIFKSASFAAGFTQYGDADMRSEFWNVAANSTYHVLLGAPRAVRPTVTERVPSGDGDVVRQSDGSKLGRINFNWFMNMVQLPLIRQFGIPPTTLTFFVTSNTRVLEQGSTTATFGGYHNTFPVGSQIFATIWGAMFSAHPKDVTHVGHEVVEWLNDPFYPHTINMVPRWRTPATSICGTNQLEVADPVTLDLRTFNNYTFEDAVFIEWFSHQAPSTAIGGDYDLFDLLNTPAVLC